MFEAPVEAPVSATSKTILHCALELSKSCWLLAIQYPDRSQPSQYRIKGGDAEGSDGAASDLAPALCQVDR